MPLHMFITAVPRKDIGEEKIIELELNPSDTSVCIICDKFGIFEVIQAIRAKKPDTIWFDSELDLERLQQWFSVVNDTIIIYNIDSYVYSYGDRPTAIPGIIHIGTKIPP